MKKTLSTATLAAIVAATAFAGYLQHVAVDMSDSRQNFPLRVARGEVVDLSVDFFDEGAPIDISGSPFVSLECKTNGMAGAESFAVPGAATNGNSALFRVKVDDFCPEASGTWTCVVSNEWATLARVGGPVFVRGTAAASSHALPKSALAGYATTNWTAAAIEGALAALPPESDPVFEEWAAANTNRYITAHQSLEPATNYTDEAVARATGNYGAVSNRAMRAALLDSAQTFTAPQNFARVPTVKVTGAGNPDISITLYSWEYDLYSGNSASVGIYSYATGESYHNDIYTEGAKSAAANGETRADFGTWGTFPITYTADDWETSESATFTVDYAEFYYSGGAFHLYLSASSGGNLSYTFSATLSTSYYDEGYGDDHYYYGYGWAASTSSSLYDYGRDESRQHRGFEGVEISSSGFEPVVSTRLATKEELDALPGYAALASATNATLSAARAFASSATNDAVAASAAYSDNSTNALAAAWRGNADMGLLVLGGELAVTTNGAPAWRTFALPVRCDAGLVITNGGAVWRVPAMRLGEVE